MFAENRAARRILDEADKNELIVKDRKEAGKWKQVAADFAVHKKDLEQASPECWRCSVAVCRRCEIEATLERLKKLERDLSSKEQELKERERRLKVWERKLIEQSSSPVSPSLSPLHFGSSSPLWRTVKWSKSQQLYSDVAVFSGFPQW